MDGIEVIKDYFPDLDEEQLRRFAMLGALYEEWNTKINLVSRKDLDQIYERHILHSLGLSLAAELPESGTVLDLGTGGGFPGIPLAILHPQLRFDLVDATRKKITAVTAVIDALGLNNARAIWERAEKLKGRYNAVVTRAVAPAGKLFEWSQDRSRRLLALKGGDLTEELGAVPHRVSKRVHPLADHFKEPFFETKVVLELRW